MSEFISEMIGRLERGEWTAAQAADAIEKGPPERKARQARWLKVRVVEDGKKKFSLKLPYGIASIMTFALGPVLKWGMEYAAKKHPEAAKIPIQKLDLKKILKTLRGYGPLVVIEAYDKDNEILIEQG